MFLTTERNSQSRAGILPSCQEMSHNPTMRTTDYTEHTDKEETWGQKLGVCNFSLNELRKLIVTSKESGLAY